MGKGIDIKDYLTQGWEMFSANMTNLIVANLILVVISLAVNIIPFGGLVVAGPLMGGMFYILLDLNAGEPFNVKRLFDGFTTKIVPLILAGIVIQILVIIGSIFLLIPGILVFGWYLLTYLYIVDRDMDFWPAMEASRGVAFENQLGMFLLALALIVVNILGVLALGVGVLVTMPVTYCTVFKVYKDQVGLVDDPANRTGAAGKVMDNKPKMKITPPPPPPAPEKGKGKK